MPLKPHEAAAARVTEVERAMSSLDRRVTNNLYRQAMVEAAQYEALALSMSAEGIAGTDSVQISAAMATMLYAKATALKVRHS